MFSQVTGIGFDKLCQGLGLTYIRVKYQDVEIIPLPLVSHVGVQGKTDLQFPLSTGENLDTYTVSVPKNVLNDLLAAALTASTNALQARLIASEINQAQYDASLALETIKYSVAEALYSDSQWYLDRGNGWEAFNTRKDPLVGLVRYDFELVKAGI